MPTANRNRGAVRPDSRAALRFTDRARPWHRLSLAEMPPRPASKPRAVAKPSGVSRARIAEMVEQATVDAYGDAEQATGWYTMFEEHLGLPFETKVLGVTVTVKRIDLRDDDRIVAICIRGRAKEVVDLAEVPLPSPRPDGAEWIGAYRAWSRQR
jgi:hypothetical protein